MMRKSTSAEIKEIKKIKDEYDKKYQVIKKKYDEINQKTIQTKGKSDEMYDKKKRKFKCNDCKKIFKTSLDPRANYVDHRPRCTNTACGSRDCVLV